MLQDRIECLGSDREFTRKLLSLGDQGIIAGVIVRRGQAPQGHGKDDTSKERVAERHGRCVM
jgi:hypothetical protein